MSKRTIHLFEEGQHVAKQPKKHWSLGLLESMNDPNSLYKETERIVVIKDKYPKAKIHFLMLPKENISSIYKLVKKHEPLIEEFGKLFKLIQEEYKDHALNAGFHAVPSMQRLHMHIISKDMVSPCLKTKVHWNSFTSTFFIPYTELLEQLKENGTIERVSNDVHKNLMVTPLKCNQCSYMPKNIPQLKEHLLTHL